MSERPPSYVGVSGVVRERKVMPSGLVVTEPQQLFVENYARQTGLFETGRILALGVKATHKSQYDDTENKYGSDWYPVGERDFTEALRPDKSNPNTMAVAQTYLDVDYVDDSEYRRKFIKQIARRGQHWLQAIQFDMLPWHNNDDMFVFLEKLRENHPKLKILLQAHGNAMNELGEEGAVRKLGEHADFVDYVLFDASHGTGKRMDVKKLGGFLHEAYSSQALQNKGIAVAGGLSAASVCEDLPKLLYDFPDVSWDAEGQLHPVNNAGKRPLHMETVRNYLQASTDVINDAKKPRAGLGRITWIDFNQ